MLLAGWRQERVFVRFSLGRWGRCAHPDITTTVLLRRHLFLRRRRGCRRLRWWRWWRRGCSRGARRGGRSNAKAYEHGGNGFARGRPCDVARAAHRDAERRRDDAGLVVLVDQPLDANGADFAARTSIVSATHGIGEGLLQLLLPAAGASRAVEGESRHRPSRELGLEVSNSE
jgi:hypothetical protein